MNAMPAIAAVILLASGAGVSAQSRVRCGQALDAAFHSRALLTIDSRPAGLEIVGTDSETLHVTCSSRDGEDAENIVIRFDPNSEGGKLTITGRHQRHSSAEIRIEVPRKTSLRVGMFAGEVKIEDVVGDKDVDVFAGQVTVSSDRAWNYRSVNVGVSIGEVQARAYNVDKGGFFRSFRRTTPDGEYRLRAHVTTGEIDLLGHTVKVSDRRKLD